jgi:reactive chlorine resistance protein C
MRSMPVRFDRVLTQEGSRAMNTCSRRVLGTIASPTSDWIGLLTLLGVISRRFGIVGAALAFLTPFVTLSFLVTTPEAWVPALGDAEHGFPYLSGGGRLVIKDVALMAGAWLVHADCARAILSHRAATIRVPERAGGMIAQARP